MKRSVFTTALLIASTGLVSSRPASAAGYGELSKGSLQRISSLNRYFTKSKLIVEKRIAELEKTAPPPSSQPAILQRFFPTKTALTAKAHERIVGREKYLLGQFEAGLSKIQESLQNNNEHNFGHEHNVGLWGDKHDQLGALERIITETHRERLYTKKSTPAWKAARKIGRNNRFTDFDALLTSIEKERGNENLRDTIEEAIKHNRVQLKELIGLAQEQVAAATAAVSTATGDAAVGEATKTLARKQAVLAGYQHAAFQTENYILKLFFRDPKDTLSWIPGGMRTDRKTASRNRVAIKKTDPSWLAQRAAAKQKYVDKLGSDAGREDLIAKMLTEANAK